MIIKRCPKCDSNYVVIDGNDHDCAACYRDEMEKRLDWEIDNREYYDGDDE